jgi:hypothetical protein
MIVDTPEVSLLVAAVLLVETTRVALATTDPGKVPRRALQSVLLTGALLHLSLAATGWLYRYEAYLVGLGLVVLAMTLSSALPMAINGTRALVGRGACAVAITVALFPLVRRAQGAWVDTPMAVRNIYEQHYQIGTFVRRYYEGASIVANDIGALTYMANVRLTDIYGLATLPIGEAKRRGGVSPALLGRVARERHAQIAVAYPSWLPRPLPDGWVEVGRWRIQANVVAGEDTVAFFALQPGSRAALIRNLKAYEPDLPPTVESRGSGVGSAFGERARDSPLTTR